MKNSISFTSLCAALALSNLCAGQAYTLHDAKISLKSGDYDRALRISKENLATATKDDQVSYLTVMADVYKYKRHDELSIPCLDKAISLIDKSDKSRVAFLHYKRGDAYSGVGNLQKALVDYNAVYASKMGTRGILNILRDRSAIYGRLNQYDKAINDLTEALKLADSMLGDKDYVTSILRTRGEKVEFLYKRSKLYDKVGKTAEAKRDCEIADKLSLEI